jgi:hypothetical protein
MGAIKPSTVSTDSGISKTRRSSIVISPNGLLSSLGSGYTKMKTIRFFFQEKIQPTGTLQSKIQIAEAAKVVDEVPQKPARI